MIVHYIFSTIKRPIAGRFFIVYCCFFLISNNTCETQASTGSSINGPITSASAIRGSSGKQSQQ